MVSKKEQISTSQLTFSVGCFIQSAAILTFSLHTLGKQEAWLEIVFGYILCIPLLLLYISLTKKFPGKSLIQINEHVFGRVIGSVFSGLYLFYFFCLAFLNTRDVGNFIGAFMLPATPMPVVLVMFIFICCWAVRKGVQTVTRYGALFVFVSFFVLLANTVLLFKNMKPENLLPLFSQPVEKYLEGAHVTAIVPIGEVMIFLMLTPHLQSQGDTGKVYFRGFAIGAMVLLVSVMRDTMVLGPVSSIVTSPTFSSVRLINIGNILTRMEILYAIILIMLLFFKVSIILYAIVTGISQLLHLDSYRFLVPTVGAIVVVYALKVFDTSMEQANWMVTGAGPMASTFFLFLLPFVTFITAAVRFRRKEAAAV